MAQAPSRPIVTLTPVDSEIDATWSVAPNGSTITGYDVSISPSPSSGAAQQTNITQTSQNFKGLKNGTLYTVTVIAHSNHGNSPQGSAQATPTANAPAKPVISAATPGPHTLQVTWQPAANAGSVSGYQATATPVSGLPSGCQPNASCTTQPAAVGAAVPGTVVGNAASFSGLANQYYAVQVTAVGSGASQPKSTSDPAYSRPWGAPGAPGVSVQANKIQSGSTTATVTVNITPPGDSGGTAITGYTVSGGLGSRTFTSGGSHSFSVNRPAGTYNVSVTATNAAGTSQAGTATATVTYASGYTVKVDNTDGGFQWNGPTSGDKFGAFQDGSGQWHYNRERITEPGHQSVGGSYYTTVNDLIGCRSSGSPGQRTGATWTANLPGGGTWKVQVFIPVSEPINGTVANWEYGPAGGGVNYKLGGQTIPIFQGQNQGQWVTVGTVSGSGSSTLTVTDQDTTYNCQSNNTATYISIDAARWVLQ